MSGKKKNKAAVRKVRDKKAKPKTADRPLTVQQQKFVNNILAGMNQTDAYLNAGYKTSRNAAEKHASRLIRNGKIEAAIKEVQDKANKAAEITHERIKQEESRLAFADIKELYDLNGKLLPLKDLPVNIRRAILGLEIIYTSLGDVKYKYKFHDKGKALERIEKMEGLFAPEKREVAHSGEVTVIDSYAVKDAKDGDTGTA